MMGTKEGNWHNCEFLETAYLELLDTLGKSSNIPLALNRGTAIVTQLKPEP